MHALTDAQSKALLAAARRDDGCADLALARLRDLDLDGLRLRWRNVTGGAPPQHLPKHLLLRIIAYRQQADVYGDLSKTARQSLDRLRRQSAPYVGQTGLRVQRADRPRLSPGTQLIREWSGVLYRVVVTAEGFAWNGTTYPSLTKVAGAITGGRSRTSPPTPFATLRRAGSSRRDCRRD